MAFSGVRLFRAPIWCPSGGWRHARGREHCRGEPSSSLSGRYAPDSAKAEGSSIVDEPGRVEPCAREFKARTGRFLREKLISDHGGHMERRTGKICGAFSRMHRALDGWMLARAPASPAQGLYHHGHLYSVFLIFVRCVALRNLELLIKTGLNVFVRFVAENTGRG